MEIESDSTRSSKDPILSQVNHHELYLTYFGWTAGLDDYGDLSILHDFTTIFQKHQKS